jgi:uncharacterized integral membrane protein
VNQNDPTSPTPTGGDVPTASDGETEPATTPPTSRPAAAAPGDRGTDPAEKTTARPHGLTGKGKVRHTRVSALYVGLVVAAILTVFLLIFIAQNSDSVTVKFLGFEGRISLAVALLLSAVIGVLVVALPGSLRIGQLRRALRRNAKT